MHNLTKKGEITMNTEYKLYANGKSLLMPDVYATESEYKEACRNYATPYRWLVNNMKLTKNGRVITVYTREELFQSLFSAILEEKPIPRNIWDKVNKCAFCNSTFIRTSHEKYCCKQCAEDANRAKALNRYYASKK